MRISLSSVYTETNVLKELKKSKTSKAARDICDSLTNSELEEIIRTENKHYHELSKPRISDLAFDTVREQLEKRKPTSKVLSQVGASIVGKKVKLPFSMGSLDKAKPDDNKLESWITLFEGPYVASDKLDGASLQYDCRDVNNPKLYTRGRDNVGRDVSHLLPLLGLPIKPIAVRGELAMKKSKFSKFSKDVGGEYENARNLVSSILTKKTADKKLISGCKFVAHEMLYPEVSPSKGLATLERYGFDVVWHKVFNKVSIKLLLNILSARKAKTHYDIDGLVVVQDKKNKRPTTGNPLYSIAFKNMEEDAIKQVKVLGIEWNVSKHGLIKPVILIEPTRMAGVTVKRVTAHNAKTVKENGLGKGAVILATRSGEVIPKFLDVIKKVQWDEPPFPYTWDKNKTEAVTTTKHKDQKVKRLYSFFSTLGVDFMGQAVAEQLYDAGFNTIKKILKAKPKDFLEVDGFKAVKANKLYDAIQSKTQNIDLAILLDALGVFGKGFGERKIRPIIEVFPNLKSLAKLSTKERRNKILAIKGYSDITATQFAENLDKALERIEKLGIDYHVAKKAAPVGKLLNGKSFLFTGFRNKDCEDYIESQSGIIARSITKDLTALVAKDILSNSEKMKKARALDIPILTFDQFRSKFWK